MYGGFCQVAKKSGRNNVVAMRRCFTVEFKMKLELKSRLRVVPHFPSGIVEWAKCKHAWKITPREKCKMQWLAFLVWGDFHVPSRFERSTIPEGKRGT